MNIAELMRWVHLRPFLPFRVRMTDGAAIDVLHPDEVVPGRTTAQVIRGPNGELFRRNVTISMLHVIRLEPIEG